MSAKAGTPTNSLGTQVTDTPSISNGRTAALPRCSSGGSDHAVETWSGPFRHHVARVVICSCTRCRPWRVFRGSHVGERRPRVVRQWQLSVQPHRCAVLGWQGGAQCHQPGSLCRRLLRTARMRVVGHRRRVCSGEAQGLLDQRALAFAARAASTLTLPLPTWVHACLLGPLMLPLSRGGPVVGSNAPQVGRSRHS